MDNFIAIDVETANPDYESICQIGVVPFYGETHGDPWVTLVNPETYFDPFNIGIHGITEDHVRDAPTFPALHATLMSSLSGKIVACHTAFDRVALSRACSRYGLPVPDCTWLDTACVARRAWTEFARSGYGLTPVTWSLGIKYRAHDAGEDARACGEVLTQAVAKTGLSVTEWLQRVRRPIDPNSTGWHARVSRTGNPDGPLSGEVIVFTGALSMSRSQAADLAARVGCDVASAVTKKTTMLVVGVQNLATLAGYEKSSKHRHAEELIREGHEIRIMHEDSFLGLVAVSECN